VLCVKPVYCHHNSVYTLACNMLACPTSPRQMLGTNSAQGHTYNDETGRRQAVTFITIMLRQTSRQPNCLACSAFT